MMRKLAWGTLLAVFATGCGGDQTAMKDDVGGGSAVPPPPPAPQDEANSDASAGHNEQVEAGYRGQGTEYGGGPVSEVVRQRFLIEDRIVRLRIRSELRTYQALNDGELPQTTEEFMADIIEANQIPLGDPRDGYEFFWDPDATEEATGAQGVLYLVPVAG